MKNSNRQMRQLYAYVANESTLGGTPGRGDNPLKWGNPPVHKISHFNLITFT